MIGRQGDGALDLRAVRRDDELLDALATRAVRSPGDLGDPSDPAGRLMAALVADVDDGLAALLAATTLDIARVGAGDTADPVVSTDAGREAGASDAARAGEAATLDDHALPSDEDGSSWTRRRRRRTAYGAAAALALGATFSVSGVAAAVTGDPFAPYRAVGEALSWGDDDLPPNAAEVAHFNKRLARARAAIAHGEVAGAQAKIDALRSLIAQADLTDGQRAALERKLVRLEAAIARVGTDGKNVPPGPKAGKGAGAKSDAGTPHAPTSGDTSSTGGKSTGEKSTGGDSSGGDSTGGAQTGGKPTDKAKGPSDEQATQDDSSGDQGTQEVTPAPTPDGDTDEGSTGSKNSGSSTTAADEDGSAATGSGNAPKKG